MDDSQQTRILTAALFTGRSLLVQLLTFRRGASTRLHLRVCPKQHDDPSVALWRYGDRHAYPPVPAVWPLKDVDPWHEASYFGPLPDRDGPRPDQRCRSCGTDRNPGANYCGQCGAAFVVEEALIAVRVAHITGYIASGSATTGADLAALIDDCTKRSGSRSNGRAELRQFIESDFDESASASFIRGEPAIITPGLTLASAEDIHQTVAATGRVLPEQIPQAELILRYAPLHFGYWGPFKALVKSVPVEDVPDAYAEALARLSSVTWTTEPPPSVHIEDTSFLSDFFDTASRKTLAYLARRARRDLAELAKRSPDTYARVATHMILSWDENLSRNAFAPAYVMLGARSPLDAQSRRVRPDPDLSSRRDAHPEIWNDRPELIQRIFDNIKHSAEAHTWSFQVLESLGQAPAITANNLKLALSSTYPPLNNLARNALPSRPGLWKSLTVEQWSAMFRNGDDDSIDGILDAMTLGSPRPAAVEAARQFLNSDAARTPERQFRVSVMFLSATQPNKKQRPILDANADVAAVIAVINYSATEHEKLWNPILRGLKLDQLERVREALPSDAQYDEVLSVVDDLLLRERARLAGPSEAINWIASANATEAELGWQLLDAGYGVKGLVERLPRWIARRLPDPSTVERVISELLPRLGLDDAPQLAQVVQEALTRGVQLTSLVPALTSTPVGRAAIWLAMSTEHGSDVAQIVETTPDFVRMIGDDVRADQLEPAAPTQLLFVLRYITGNPSRITGDLAFGLAAAKSTEQALQIEAISQLQAGGQLPQSWVALAESQAPNALAAARSYVASLPDPLMFRDAIRFLLDSRAPALRDVGAQLVHGRLQLSDDRSLWSALAESDDPRLQETVALEALGSGRADERALREFDRRVLVDPSSSRRIKESVKARLERMGAGSGLASQERIVALLELARGQTLMDREWALGKLAELALAGITIEGLGISLVTDDAS